MAARGGGGNEASLWRQDKSSRKGTQLSLRRGPQGLGCMEGESRGPAGALLLSKRPFGADLFPLSVENVYIRRRPGFLLPLWPNMYSRATSTPSLPVSSK